MLTRKAHFLTTVVALVSAILTAPGTAVAVLPPYFVDQVAFAGLTQPTKVAFAADGRVFVAEKRGVIKVFDNLVDTTATTFADLSTAVYDYEDLGLLGLALAPGFPGNPWVYVSYTHDAPPGGTAPVYRDTCPATDSCLASGRVSRLRASGNGMIGAEQVLVTDWCQQSDTHSMGDVAFGPDGALYVAGGEGASGNQVDYGQLGTPTNPCGDPPSPVGGAMTPPTARGGALRSQSPRSGGPARLSGTVIRINPATGAALPDNPQAGSLDANTRRIIAYGLRNPFRFVFRPGTREIWLGDVGFRDWEEIDRLVPATSGAAPNYGWPCYEGATRQPNYDAANLNLCETLYTAGPAAVVAPFHTYRHALPVVPGDGCRTTSGAITGLAYLPETPGNYPARYKGGLFFTDLLRQCVWAIKPGSGGVPNPRYIQPLGSTIGLPVDLAVGPDCNVYYVSITTGAVRRYVYKTGGTGGCPP
ncbi:glucose/arabinose dehydrogenase [Micromonospora pisi]|uniref:Glucose/arabinose dehydrogenase n=1 Tax=Micromonospora pisi TaxID=589240 RepID=A0A495JFV3_9ACTN|nr:PQQ-dependent sugar dehydrogenase [Micromonospora pisi]RKR87631.1 glucose/arabinose dehydrogenase [Micromonospora pisi]